MKSISIYLIATLLLCATVCKAQTNLKVDATSYAQTSTTNWVDNLKKLRLALYHQQQSAYASFFDFPITDNEMVSFTYNDSLHTTESALTQALFIKHFNQIFPTEFIQAFNKVKTTNLFKTNKATGSILKIGDIKHQVTVSYNKKQKIVSIRYDIDGFQKIENSSEVDPIEATYNYEFKVDKKGMLKFNKFFLAG